MVSVRSKMNYSIHRIYQLIVSRPRLSFSLEKMEKRIDMSGVKLGICEVKDYISLGTAAI